MKGIQASRAKSGNGEFVDENRKILDSF